jgi:DNA-directed RNA polymerase specialized sigma24 family protein
MVPEQLEPERSGLQRKKGWLLDQSGFETLLGALHPDRDEAAERYTGLRARLSRFFAWNHADDPDALADEVLDRVTRRVVSSTADTSRNEQDEAVRQPEKFAAGVARMLLRENWRVQKTRDEMVSALALQSQSLHEVKEDQRRVEKLSALLEECLAELTSEQRELIERYYSADARSQIDARRRLAEESNISLNALRNRAMRIRSEVEKRAKERLEQAEL